MRRVYRYRLYPTAAQDRALRGTLGLLRELYNAALQERRDAYRATGKSPTCYDQQKSLREVRALRPEVADVHTHLLQDALTRLERAFQAFFRRVKAGETPGYPRFKGRDRYRTFTFKDAANGNGAALCAGDRRLRLAGIGKVKLKLHRPYEGRLKQVSVTLDGDGHWYAALVCDDVRAKPLPATGRTTGVDLGLLAFGTLVDGTPIANPRVLESARDELSQAQRRVSRRRKRSHRRRKAVRILARKHARVRNARKHFHHTTARDLVRAYDSIAIEDLNIKGLARSMLARPIHDAAWAQFTTILSGKAEEAGRTVVKVDPRGTSQVCSACGCEVRKALAVRVHRCPHCGYTADRDVNAARNIHRLGHSRRRPTPLEGVHDARSPSLGR